MGIVLRGMKYLLLAASFAALAGCGAALTGSIKAPPDPVSTGVFSAGAQKTYITPPPGYPMGGPTATPGTTSCSTASFSGFWIYQVGAKRA